MKTKSIIALAAFSLFALPLFSEESERNAEAAKGECHAAEAPRQGEEAVAETAQSPAASEDDTAQSPKNEGTDISTNDDQ